MRMRVYNGRQKSRRKNRGGGNEGIREEWKHRKIGSRWGLLVRRNWEKKKRKKN